MIALRQNFFGTGGIRAHRRPARHGNEPSFRSVRLDSTRATSGPDLPFTYKEAGFQQNLKARIKQKVLMNHRVKYTQPSDEIRQKLRDVYANDAEASPPLPKRACRL